jgi:UDP-GlcNAc:undecaprenyl-phosphate GlcNAc-1-phosphate transferase
VLRLLPLQLTTIAAFLSLSIIPLMWRFAPRLGLVDVPDSRKVHSMPVPRVGGWGITLGTVLPLALWVKFDTLLLSFVAAILILFAFGIWDDVRNIGHWPKFLGQLLATGAVVYYGGLYVERVPFFDEPLNETVAKPLSMFALIGAINAFNHSDGLDGLAAGESMLTLLGLAILGYLGGSPIVIGIALSMMGGILGFLRYNSYPAQVFMGDSGSQVLGFALGFLAIYLTQRVDTALSAAVPLLLLGVPIADIVLVLYKRIRAKTNWFRASRNHLHHRLLDLGIAHRQTVIILYFVHALLVVAAVLMRYQPDLNVATTYVLIVSGSIAGLAIAEHSQWKPGTGGSRGEGAGELWRSRVARTLPQRLIWIMAPALTLFGSLWSGHVPRDVGLVAALLAAVLAYELGFARAVRAQIIRLSVYVAAIASAYLAVNYPGVLAPRGVEVGAIALVACLVAAIAAYVRFGGDQKFSTTPTDYLTGFTVLALLVFAAIDAGSRPLVQIIVFAIALLYGCEVVIGRTVKRWSAFNVTALVTLTILAVRGLL